MNHYINSFPGREIVIADKKYLYFGGTAYLGLQTNAQFRALFIKNIQQYGSNYGASRNANVQLKVFEQAEESLAAIVGSEACVTLSSGYLAGQFVCHYFRKPAYQLFYAPNTHIALYQDALSPYPTFATLQEAIAQHLEAGKPEIPVLFVDTVDFCGGHYPHFEQLKTLALDKLILVADDSHGIGIMGNEGGGAYAALAALQPKELVVCSSLGKGYGVQSGAVFGTSKRITQLMDTPFFSGASPATPAAIASLMQGGAIYRNQRELLQKRITQFFKELSYPEKFSYLPGHPAMSFSDEKLSSYLEKEGIVVTNFYYGIKKTLMSKVILSALHTVKDVEYLTNCINTYFDKNNTRA